MEEEKKVWKKQRWIVETVFSSINRTFGEYMYME